MQNAFNATHYLISKDRMKRATLEDRLGMAAVTITILSIAAIIGMAIWHW
jgi:hypothetical protein